MLFYSLIVTVQSTQESLNKGSQYCNRNGLNLRKTKQFFYLQLVCAALCNFTTEVSTTEHLLVHNSLLRNLGIRCQSTLTCSEFCRYCQTQNHGTLEKYWSEETCGDHLVQLKAGLPSMSRTSSNQVFNSDSNSNSTAPLGTSLTALMVKNCFLTSNSNPPTLQLVSVASYPVPVHL